MIEAKLPLVPRNDDLIFFVNFQTFYPNAHFFQRFLILQAQLNMLTLLINLNGKQWFILTGIIKLKDKGSIDARSDHRIIGIIKMDKIN